MAIPPEGGLFFLECPRLPEPQPTYPMNTDTLERTDLATIPPDSTPSGQPSAAKANGSQPSSYQEVKEAAGEQFRQAADGLKESGDEALQSAKEAGNHFVDEQKEKFASRIDHYTDAVKAACETLQATEGNPLVSPAQRASRQMERAADYLRSHDAMDFLDDLGNLARRRPEIVFGGLFVIGLASMRFLKASSRDRRNPPVTGASDYNKPPVPRPYQPAGDSAPLQSTPTPFSNL